MAEHGSVYWSEGPVGNAQLERSASWQQHPIFDALKIRMSLILWMVSGELSGLMGQPHENRIDPSGTLVGLGAEEASS
jgi:hypothetical protein